MRKQNLTAKIHRAKKLSHQPGIEASMQPKPIIDEPRFQRKQKLKNKVAIITGGDSGIGHATAISFARNGADIVIVYLNEHRDAKKTQKEIMNLGRKCLLLAGDVGKDQFCNRAVQFTLKHLKKIDILVNNAAEQHPQKSLSKITKKQLIQTFTTNIYSYFFMTQAALPYLKKGSVIINTTSVTAYKGSKELIDYSATKGAVVAFTRSLSASLVEKGIRVNGVAPGPIWTPLIPSTFNRKKIKKFGSNVAMKRPGQPDEVAPCYLFLASEDSSYMTGQILHPNGGEIVNG